MKKLIVSMLWTTLFFSNMLPVNAFAEVQSQECEEKTEKLETSNIEKFIVNVGEHARLVAQKNDLYASVMIAQSILESGSGSSILAQAPNNNLFGIKGDYEGQFIIYRTWEHDELGNSYNIDAAFRVYPNIEESFKDYASLMIHGTDWNPKIYQGTWKSFTNSYEDATKALTGVYATDVEYSKKLNNIIETYNLTKYDQSEVSNLTENNQNETVNDKENNYEPYNNVNYDINNSYAWGNCTQYVYNRITQLGGYIDLDMGNGADWGVTGALRGYEVTSTPKSGTAVSFNPGVLGADATYGHVAFVEKVYTDGSILISEMNAQGLNVVSNRIISSVYADGLSYITPK